MTIVVVKDSISKAVVAHSVPCKGVAVDWTAQQLVRDIKRLGYRRRVVLKSDQELAITALLDEVAAARTDGPTSLEYAPCSDSRPRQRGAGGQDKGLTSA